MPLPKSAPHNQQELLRKARVRVDQVCTLITVQLRQVIGDLPFSVMFIPESGEVPIFTADDLEQSGGSKIPDGSFLVSFNEGAIDDKKLNDLADLLTISGMETLIIPEILSSFVTNGESWVNVHTVKIGVLKQAWQGTDGEKRKGARNQLYLANIVQNDQLRLKVTTEPLMTDVPDPETELEFDFDFNPIVI